MAKYVILYRNNKLTVLEAPFGFTCTADNMEAAEEQCLAEQPDADIVWAFEGDDYQDALADYYG